MTRRDDVDWLKLLGWVAMVLVCIATLWLIVWRIVQFARNF